MGIGFQMLSKKERNAVKMNRALTTGIGSFVHTGGSIPINVHKKEIIIISSY